jgi:uncharacterized membrane protein YfcA
MLAPLKVLAVGVLVGFLGGAFGKGGSAVATPLLQLAGVPAMFAVASPLPATIPSTLVASLAYLRRGLYDRQVVAWTLASGLPAVLLGAALSGRVGGRGLLLASDALVAGLGATLLLRPHGDAAPVPRLPRRAAALAIGAGVGLLSGLLANTGGFLFAPLYSRVLGMPLKSAFACSLVASAVLAVPGTAVHVALGHVSWPIVVVLGLGSVPLAHLGARAAIALKTQHLELAFGAALVLLGVVGLARALA